MSDPAPSAAAPLQCRPRTLAFIALVARRGFEQIEEPEPLNALGLLTLHDAVELFLQLAAEHRNAQVSDRTEFPQYFQRIDSKLAPDALTGTNRELERA